MWKVFSYVKARFQMILAGDWPWLFRVGRIGRASHVSGISGISRVS